MKREATSPFDRIRAVADAVLLEGYLLYPYRANAPKNRIRWSFGVLAPSVWSEAGGCEPSWMQAHVPIEGAHPLEGRLRFFRIESRQVEALEPATSTFRPVDHLEVPGGALYLTWEEGAIEELPFTLHPGEARLDFALPESTAHQEIRGPDGALLGRVERRRLPLELVLHARYDADDSLLLRIENPTRVEPGLSREQALRSSSLSTHLLLSAAAPAFLSLLDPPAHRAEKSWQNVRCWPVLAGETGDRRLLLVSPIILYDHPRLAPESPGDLFDSTEIDELLSLRTATLTEQEKRLARATDPRAAAIVDRVESYRPADWERLHGAVRTFDGPEMVPAHRLPNPGTRVRLKPGSRGTDAQDLLYAGMLATVRRVEHDVDGRTWLAVTIDGDPAAEIYRWYGRFHYYLPEEVEWPV